MDRTNEAPKVAEEEVELIKNCHSGKMPLTTLDGRPTDRPTAPTDRQSATAAENKFEADSRLRFISSGQAEQIHGLRQTGQRGSAEVPLTLSASHPIQPQDTLFQTMDMEKEGARG